MPEGLPLPRPSSNPHAEGCPCQYGDGESYCNCGAAVRAVLTAQEAGLLEVLASEEIARHNHPPHALISARDKLRKIAEDL